MCHRVRNSAFPIDIQTCLQKTVSTVTMQDIIDRTGLSQGGIYRFYKDIDDIFADMIRQLRERTSIRERADGGADGELFCLCGRGVRGA